MLLCFIDWRDCDSSDVGWFGRSWGWAEIGDGVGIRIREWRIDVWGRRALAERPISVVGGRLDGEELCAAVLHGLIVVPPESGPFVFRLLLSFSSPSRRPIAARRRCGRGGCCLSRAVQRIADSPETASPTDGHSSRPGRGGQPRTAITKQIYRYIHPNTQSKLSETYKCFWKLVSKTRTERKKPVKCVASGWRRTHRNMQKPRGRTDFVGKAWRGKLEGIEDLRRLVEFRCANNMENVISSESQI